VIAAILTFNHPELSTRCINSVRDYFSDKDIFVLHNGSQIHHIETLKDRFESINHLVLPNNLGFSGGANYLLNRVFLKSEYALFITNDCVVKEFKTEDSIFKQQTNIIIPYIYYKFPSKIDSVGGGVNLKTGSLIHYKLEKEKKDHYEDYIPGSCFFLSKRVFELVGGFDESLGTYWEDVDWSLRAKQHKVSFHVSNNLSIEHKGGKTCHKDKYYTSYLFQRNRIIVCSRWTKNLSVSYRWYFISWLRLKVFFKIIIRLYKGKFADAKLLKNSLLDSLQKL